MSWRCVRCLPAFWVPLALAFLLQKSTHTPRCIDSRYSCWRAGNGEGGTPSFLSPEHLADSVSAGLLTFSIPAAGKERQ